MDILRSDVVCLKTIILSKLMAVIHQELCLYFKAIFNVFAALGWAYFFF